jgi:hypothetical protein
MSFIILQLALTPMTRGHHQLLFILFLIVLIVFRVYIILSVRLRRAKGLRQSRCCAACTIRISEIVTAGPATGYFLSTSLSAVGSKRLDFCNTNVVRLFLGCQFKVFVVLQSSFKPLSEPFVFLLEKSHTGEGAKLVESIDFSIENGSAQNFIEAI